MYEDVKSENLVAYLIHRGPAEPNHWFRTVPIGQSSVSIIGGLVEPDVVSVEQPTIRETEVFGLHTTLLVKPCKKKTETFTVACSFFFSVLLCLF